MLKQVAKLLELIKDVPHDWFDGKGGSNGYHTSSFTIPKDVECSSYLDLAETWQKAIHWSRDIDFSFSAMHSIVASTMLQGSQIWLRVIGSPGSLKTTLCEAIGASSDYCHNFSKFTGIHSGDNKLAEGERPADKIINKTCIVNEGDMIVSAPKELQMKIMSELRDIYSGIIRSQYLNGAGMDLTGVRSTWIIAGTSSLRMLNRSQLGDRFLDVIIHKRKRKGGEDEGEAALLKSVSRSTLNRLRNVVGGETHQRDTPEKVLAAQKTIGFVKYLRENTPNLINQVIDNFSEQREQQCTQLAQLTAYMRVRPDAKADPDDIEPELATRLTEQYERMAACEAIVLGKTEVDDEVMQRVAKVTDDTCFGGTYTIVKTLYNAGKPLTKEMLVANTEYGLDKVKHAIKVLFDLGCVRSENSKNQSGVYGLGKGTGLWRLSPQMTTLMKNLNTLLQ